jgi:hypothetical protein
MSGDEKSAAIHLPLFAAANALYSSAKDQCPRLQHDKVTRTTSALLLLRDGQQLIDATTGFKDNDAPTTELLGLHPTRHTP